MAGVREHIDRTFEVLVRSLRPYVERKYQERFGANWKVSAAQVMRNDRDSSARDDQVSFGDPYVLLNLMDRNWSDIFASHTMKKAQRGFVAELLKYRNDHAHREPLTLDDAFRTVDSAKLLLKSIDADAQLVELDELRQEVLKLLWEQQNPNVILEPPLVPEPSAIPEPPVIPETATSSSLWSLRLGSAYYTNGFFNVPVEQNPTVRSTDGPVSLELQGHGIIHGRANHQANQNGTARIYGNAPLRGWFHSNFALGDMVRIDIVRPDYFFLRLPVGE